MAARRAGGGRSRSLEIAAQIESSNLGIEEFEKSSWERDPGKSDQAGNSLDPS